jgi:hypothetical protein
MIEELHKASRFTSIVEETIILEKYDNDYPGEV